MTATQSDIPRYSVIGLGVDAVDYSMAVETCQWLAQQPHPTAVAAANTHIAVLSREDPNFAAAMKQFDLVVPDGAPLVWMMNRQGAALSDRVYGPYLMREVIRHSPAPWSHFLLGGTESCLQQLPARLGQLQLDLRIDGTFSPPFRDWEDRDLNDMAERIDSSKADFIWVALGGGRQERLIQQLRLRVQRGCFLAVGDAFPLLAGMHQFAPSWMQRLGLTWAWRLAQEPQRLAGRYWHNHTAFLRYAAPEWINPPSPITAR